MTAPNKLPAHIEALLDLERGAAGMPTEAKSRVLARLGHSLPTLPDGGAGDGAGGQASTDGGGSAGLDGAGEAAAQAAAHGSTATSAASSSLLAVLAQKPVLLAATMFALGGASGALVYHSASDRGTGPVAVEANPRPAHVAELTAPAVSVFDAGLAPADDAAVMAEVPQAVVATPVRRPRQMPPSQTSDEQLAAERALIEVARAALARSDSRAALDSLQRHARTFARGQLSEEREALWIRALVIGGDLSAAAVRAEKFQNRYPRSLFLPMIRDALAKSRNQP